jgi:hypothetical protein
MHGDTRRGSIWIKCKRNQPRGEHIYLNLAKGMPLSFSKQVTYLKAVYDGGQHSSKKVFKTMEIITNELQNERMGSPNATLRKCWEKETAHGSTWRLLARFGAPPVHRLEFGGVPNSCIFSIRSTLKHSIRSILKNKRNAQVILKKHMFNPASS